jgi:hypothetical protein
MPSECEWGGGKPDDDLRPRSTTRGRANLRPTGEDGQHCRDSKTGADAIHEQ